MDNTSVGAKSRLPYKTLNRGGLEEGGTSLHKPLQEKVTTPVPFLKSCQISGTGPETPHCQF
jgi:hypothetical protein